ncbi:carboxypeptidase regulatory-like domain-containing protein [Pseudalkalibacillus berkeleyi]|uniref:Carboxypeptidase regulatory-like domain-containing protein n=1 Tax=Pseudalkalibacillus berkeleyi TaxID=1069813 RepID=A0ABS9H083_9BACL|nr:carboxypeptidase regulatory-like domain-containing protein [Pseudalkalibacillus berkeleyi]MCF6137491.1 carboxypeptidase regulatory-like domain-containing protein [Pseudalkalibacillus berkeleyi]
MPFPKNNQFTPIRVGGIPYADVIKDMNPASTDIVGNGSFPSFYFAYDTINVYFRMRVRSDPRNKSKTSFANFAWGVLLNTTGVAGTYDWLLAVNGRKNRVNLVQNVDKKFNSWNDKAEGTNGKGEPNYSRQIINFDVARVVQADTTFGNTQNYFIDFLIPASTFFSFLEVSPEDAVQMIAFTATNNNNYNKDSLRRSEGFQFKDALSNPVTIDSGNVKAQLEISKEMTSGPTEPIAGQDYEWSGKITLTNIGKSQATIVNVVDVVALDVVSGFTVTSISQGSTAFNQGMKTLTWTVGDLEAGESATLNFVENGSFYTSGNQVLNVATAIGYDLFTGGELVPVRKPIAVDVQATGGVAGNVLNQVNGLPEGEVTVRLLSGATEVAVTETNSAGDYNFSTVNPGSYNLEFSKPDFTTSNRVVVVTEDNVTIVNQYLDPLLGNLEGTVTSSGGSAIESAEVFMMNNVGDIVSKATTSPTGQYTLNNIQPGHYVLTATADNFQSNSIGKEIVSNSTTTENFVLISNPGTVQGEIAGNGTPLSSATVDIIGSTGLIVASTTTDGAGQYVINQLAPGSYRLRSSKSSFQTFNIGFAVLAGQTVEVNLDLLPNPGSLSGTVKDDDTGDLLQGSSIKVTNSFGLTCAHATTDLNGEYFVEALAPGNYAVSCASQGHGTENIGAYIKSDQNTNLSISLKRLTGVLAGTVLSDGTPISGAKIDVVSNNVVISKTVSDENGSYIINGLTPGRYTIIFTAEGYSTTTLGAIIENNQTFSLNAELKTLFGSITGTVTDIEGNVLPGAVLLINNSDSDVLVSRRVTNSNGNYSVGELNPGSYIVTASFNNYQSLLGGTIITSGDQSELDFSLSPDPSSVEGTIYNEETDEPIMGVSILMQLIDSNGVVLATTFSNIDGEFIFENVLPNTYTVNASTDGFRSSYASVKTEPGQVSTTRIELVPIPGFITGTLTDEDTELPIGGATITISNALGFQVDSMLTSADGQFLSMGLPAGIYTLAVVAKGYETNLVGEIVPWGFTKSIDIQLKANPGSIKGTITPAADNLVVQLFSLDNQLINSTAADPSGVYEFQNLAQGNYILKAAALNYSIACTGAYVEAGNETIVPMTIKPNPGTISGNIVNDIGETLPNTTISLLDVNETPIAYGNTDINGNYFIGNVPPGSYALIAKLMMHTTTTGTVTVNPGQEVTDVDFVMDRKRGIISGGVSDSITGKVVTGASILLRNSLGILIKNATTDQFGKFLFFNIGPDSYTVTSSAPNYSTEINGVIVQSGETSGLNVRLRSLVGNISGQVVDENGNPIGGDNVQVKLMGANRELLQALLASPDGSFIIPSLSEGTYQVSATLEGYTSNLVSVIITPGEVSNVKVQLSPILTTLQGTVFNSETGEPISGTAVTLSLTKNTGVFVTNQYPSNEGVFIFDSISPGIYLLNVNAEGYGNQVLTLTVPEEGTTIDVPLLRNPGAITGYVTNQLSSEPLTNAVVTIVNQGKTLENNVVSDSFGQFTFPNLSPGRYRALVTAGGFSSQSATFDVLSDQTTSLSFILTPEPGDLIGTVTSTVTGEPIASVNIQVRYLTPTGPVYASTLTDEQGVFRTQGLYAGTYTVIAFSEERFGSSSASVVVPANGTRTIDFALEPFPSTAEGTIRDEITGEPVENVFVRLLDIHGSSIQVVNSDRDGFYRFSGFTSSQYLISAISPDYQRVQVSVNPQPGETVVADLFFTPEPGRISGLILDIETGSPLVGAQVEVYSPGSTVPVARRTAGASGNFLIEGVAPGTFTINAYTLNYSQEIKGIVVEPNDTTDLEFRLAPDPVSVSGTAVDENGHPLANVSVRIIDRHEVEIGNGISDIDGNFAIGNLPNGSYTIIAGIDDYAEFTTGISVPPGGEFVGLEVVMIQLGGTFSGKVVSTETSEGIAGVLVSVSTPEGIPIISTNSDPNGDFVSPLLSPGMYTVIASSPYFIQDQTGVIIVSNETSNVSFALQGIGGTIKGAAVTVNGEPITNNSVTIRLLNDNGALLQTLQAKSDGTFEILNLPQGTYQVNVNAEGFQTATVGSIVVNGEVTNLITPLTLAGGSIEGTIVDSETGLSIPGSFVEVSDVNGVLVTTITSDQNGEFILPDVKVGPLNIKGIAPSYGASTIGVIVEPGEISSIQLSLTLITGSLSGVVIDPDGTPIGNSTVLLNDATNTSVSTVITGTDGSYEILQLVPGDYTLNADANRFGSNIVSGTILPDQESVVDIVLIPDGGIVQGTIKNKVNDEPLIGASLELRSVSPFGPVINTVLTDSDGNYNFGTISVGTYTIVVTMNNFGSETGSILVENAVTHTHDFNLSPNPSSVQGTISTDGVPIMKTVVKLVNVTGTNVAEVQTDEQGRFLIQNFNAGTYSLLVSNPDYQAATKGFTVKEGETATTDFDLTALPGVIKGTIVDEQTGLPIGGAVIQIVFGDSVQPIDRAITDPSGNYVIDGLAPGGYTVSMTTPNYNTFMSGATVTPNDTIQIDGLLGPNPGVATGTVSGPEGPITGATIKVIDVNGTVIGSAVSDGSGSFSIGNLPVGTFAVTVVAQDHHSDTQGITISPGEVESMEFSLNTQPGSIIGKIRDQNGNPLPGTVINVLLNGLIISSVVTDEDGDYTFENLQPNSYQVSSNKPGYAVSSIGAVVNSNEVATANATLTSVSGSINGTVTDQDGNPIRNQSIFVNLFDQNNSFITSVLAQPDGTYTITNVLEGNYILTTTTEGYSPNTFSIPVESGEVSELDLLLTPQGGTLSVQVIENPTSIPLPGVITDVYNDTGIPITSGITDQDGSLKVENLEEGLVVISAAAPNYTNATQSAIIENGAIAEALLAISPETSNLVGVITDPNGNPIAGATIQIMDSKRSVVTTVLTQSDGGYAVFDLALGIYTMLINSPGYEQQSLSADIKSGESTVTNLNLAFSPGNVEGVVTDAETGSFLARTNVELRLISTSGPVVASTITDAQGNYRFTDVTSGNYTIVATHRVYGNDSTTIAVEPNMTTFADLQLIRKTASVACTVRNSESDEPLPNTLLRIASQNGTVVAEMQTDLKGEILYEGLQPGKYSMAAINRDYRSEITSFTADPGEPTRLIYNLVALPSQFTGIVTDASTGIPIVGAIVEAYDLLDRPVAVALTNIEGAYTIPALSDGTYTLRATAQGYGAAARLSTLIVNDTNIENFALLPNPATVSGTVISSGNGPLKDAAVSVFNVDGTVVGNTSTNTDGTYFIGNLNAGQYSVSADADGYLEENIKLSLTNGEEKTGVDFNLKPGANGDIVGQVSDSTTGLPLSDVFIQLLTRNDELIDEVTTNAEGVFSFLGTPAGSYELRATISGYDPYSTLVELRDEEELLLLISLVALKREPSYPGAQQFYIVSGGKVISLNNGTLPTIFTLVEKNDDETCATFSYVEAVGGVNTKRFILFDLTQITLIRV